MKTTKEQVYHMLQFHFMEGSSEGVSTQYIADLFNLQRPNASTILNSLAAEKLVGKTNGRPVLYYAKREDNTADSCFSNLVGHGGSLRRAVQLAQAAVLYPQGRLNTLIIGQGGTGKKFLAMLMHRYAMESGTILPDAPYHLLDCAGCEQEDELLTELFGDGERAGRYEEARRGTLVIDGLHLTGSVFRSQLLEKLQASGGEDESPDPMIVILCDGNHTVARVFQQRLPVTIELPALSERPLEERKELIQNFLTLEAARAHRSIVISAELMRCLLLYDTDYNIARLKYDIKLGCANAYVRERSFKNDVLNLYVGDFDNNVRKGFLKYRVFRDEIERIIPSDYSYRFSETSFEMTAIDRDKLKDATLYSMIERRATQLTERGLPDRDISLLLAAELEPSFRAYRQELARKVVNAEHLGRLVDGRVIKLVESFLAEASAKLGEIFPSSVVYGLCLHLDATLKNGPRRQVLHSDQIQEILENYHTEYALCAQFARRIEDAFSIALPVDEVILLTMFICFKEPPMDIRGKPVVLYALQGAGLSRALASTVNTAMQLDNVYDFEVPMEEDLTAFYDDLQTYVKQIDRGHGIIALYDTDFMIPIFTSISNETGIEIRPIPLPVVNIGLEISRQAATETDVDILYHEIIGFLQEAFTQKPPVIVTLCTTGEGGALQLKQYLEQYGDLRETQVLPMAMAQRERLKEELGVLMKNRMVKCIIGPIDPKMYGIPFLSVNEVFSATTEQLPGLLRGGRRESKGSGVDYEAVCEYLEEHLTHVPMAKLKKLLPIALREIHRDILPLSSDTEIGLFLHIPCCMERILSKGELPVLIQKNRVINRYRDSYKKLLQILKPIEKAFHVIFNEDELAILLTIIYKI